MDYGTGSTGSTGDVGATPHVEVAASLVLMGVSGCGKSSVAAAVAARLGLPLVEGDDFHPEANQARMREGIALTDADRAAWLELLGEQLQRRPQGAVLRSRSG